MASARVLQTLETLCLRIGALIVALLLFGLFILLVGKSPIAAFANMYQGSFASWTSFQFTLKSAAPLFLTALCTALPAQLGMVVIGGEGAVLMGGLAAALIGLSFEGSSPLMALTMMLCAGALAGGLWITLAGALRYFRGVNETISSLLLNYIAIALLNHCVEGPFKDPESLNKPSTRPLADEHMLGSIPGMDVHWGLAYGIIACLFCYVLIQYTTFGFAIRTTGGNIRAGRIVGLSVGALTMIVSFMAGAFAGIAGMVDVAAVNGQANSALIAGYGYAGILVSFIARHNPLAIIPVSILMGGILASGDLLQSRMQLPDAATRVLQGIIFIVILGSESLYGRFKIFQAKEPSASPAKPTPPAPSAEGLAVV